MGGKIGGRGMSIGEIRELQDEAKAAIRGSGASRRSVFISFASADLGTINMLRGQARNRNIELDFIDASLKVPFKSEKAEYIRRGLRERIRQASVTLVYLSDHTHQSEWVDWEVRESQRQGKGIIAVHAGDRPPRQLPAVVREFGIRVVPWSHGELTAAIEQASQERS